MAAVAGFFFEGAGSEGGGGHFTASHFASRRQWGVVMIPVIVVVVVVILGTLFSSWQALAGAGYLLRGGCGQSLVLLAGVLTLHLVPFLFPPSRSHWLLQYPAGRRTCPGARGGAGGSDGNG